MTLINLEPPRDAGYQADVPTGTATVFYCTALLISFAWARWWTIRNFDKLTGRTLKAPDAVLQVRHRAIISPPYQPSINRAAMSFVTHTQRRVS